MTDAQPTLVPEGIDNVGTQSSGMGGLAPNQPPPALSNRGASGLSPAGRTQMPPPPMGAHVAPTLPTTGSSIGAAISVWQNNKQVDALWTINQDRNSWMGVAGIGWRKLAPGSETSLSAMTMLVAHARCTNSPINYRDESDNLVHEIYVW
jgi:hypothetical protein